MTDTEILDWLERYQAEVRHRWYMPDNKPTDKPWWVAPKTGAPWTGRTLREAVEASAAALSRLEARQAGNG